VAIKPITNENAGYESNVNRESQTSIRSEKGNPKVVIKKPGGQNAGKGFSIGIKEIDTAVIKHIRNIMKPKIKEQNEIISVPVLYGNEERWKSVKDRGTLRDKNGSIILPIIVIKRTSIAMNDQMPLSFDNDVKGKFINVVRSSSGWSKNNRYDRFAILTGQQPVQEFVKTGMPDFVVCTYQVVMMTSFIEQMNDLNNLWVEHLETYFGDQTSYRFLSSLDGDISNEIEMESQGERMIRNEFTMTIKGYMIPEFTDNIFGKTAELGRAYNPKKVSFSEKLL
jgi:glutaredoxin